MARSSASPGRPVLASLFSFLMPSVEAHEKRDIQASAFLQWAIIPVVFAISAGLLWHLGIGFDLPSMGRLALPLMVLPAAIFFTVFRFEPMLAALLGAIAFLGLAAPFLVMLTYSVTGLGSGLPLIDPWLASADAFLGFDWRTSTATLDALAGRYPIVDTVLRIAYGTIKEQLFAIILILVAARRYERLQAFLFAYILSLCAVVILACLLPAVGTYEFYAVDPSLHPNLKLTVQNEHIGDYGALRDGTYPMFSMATAKGIVTFPSFHATMAILFIWATWDLPVIRWPSLAFNLLMLVSTPYYGSHFVTDVIAGSLLAPISVAAAWWIRRRGRDWFNPAIGRVEGWRQLKV